MRAAEVNISEADHMAKQKEEGEEEQQHQQLSVDRIQQEQHQQVGNSNSTGNCINADTYPKNSPPPREPQQHQQYCSPIRLPTFKDPRSFM